MTATAAQSDDAVQQTPSIPPSPLDLAFAAAATASAAAVTARRACDVDSESAAAAAACSAAASAQRQAIAAFLTALSTMPAGEAKTLVEAETELLFQLAEEMTLKAAAASVAADARRARVLAAVASAEVPHAPGPEAHHHGAVGHVHAVGSAVAAGGAAMLDAVASLPGLLARAVVTAPAPAPSSAIPAPPPPPLTVAAEAPSAPVSARSALSSGSGGGGAVSNRGGVAVSDSSLCSQCRASFSLFHRRHTCKVCRAAVCSGCSEARLQLGGSREVRRVCDACVREVQHALVPPAVPPQPPHVLPAGAIPAASASSTGNSSGSGRGGFGLVPRSSGGEAAASGARGLLPRNAAGDDVEEEDPVMLRAPWLGVDDPREADGHASFAAQASAPPYGTFSPL